MLNKQLKVKMFRSHLRIMSSNPIEDHWFIIEGISEFELYEIPQYGGKAQFHSRHIRLSDALTVVDQLT